MNGNAKWQATRLRIAERDDYTCQICGLLALKGTVDHIAPRAAGGSNDDNNLQWAHRGCNNAKGCKVLCLLVVSSAVLACSAPSTIEGINTAVNDNHPYQNYAKRDYRELKPGEPGNCAAIAYTKKAHLAREGISSTMVVCRLKTGEGHAFLLTDEGALDNRFNRVVPLSEVGCAW